MKQAKLTDGRMLGAKRPALSEAPRPAGLKQVRLEDLRKVQILSASYATEADLAELKDQLHAAEAAQDTQQQLHYLNRLSCYELSYQQLVDSQIGPVVRRLRKSQDPGVSRVATGLLEKLRDVARRKAKQQQKAT